MSAAYAREKLKARTGGEKGRQQLSCDHGLSRRSLRLKPLRVELESKSDDKKKEKKAWTAVGCPKCTNARFLVPGVV